MRSEFLKFTQRKGWAKSLSRNLATDIVSLKKYLYAQTSFLPDNAKIAQRSWHIINNTYEIPICEACKENQVKYDNTSNKYRTWCSAKCASSAQSVKDKFRKTNLQKYGVPYPAMNEKVYNKVIQTNLKRYGVKYSSEAEEVKLKQKSNNLKKYGVVSTAQLDSVKRQRSETNIEKYGSISTNGTPLDPEISSKLSDAQWLTRQHMEFKKSCTDIARELKCHNSTVAKYFVKHQIDVIHRIHSSMELELKEWLTNNNIAFTSNNRELLDGLELDILIPSHGLAIECNGTYWHSDLFKTTNYHFDKTIKCNHHGIRLIQIFETEWLEKKDIIKNTLSYILNISTIEKIGARKCEVLQISSAEKTKFLNLYHIQGNGRSSVSFGLKHNEKIIAVAAFLKEKDHFVLNRYATACIVPGGFGKLLNHFEKEFNYPKIITFADLRWGNGHLYHRCCFKLDKVLPPDYCWGKGNKLFHKFNFRHSGMQKKLKKYDPLMSENDNMTANNFFKVYDAGKLKFIKNDMPS